MSIKTTRLKKFLLAALVFPPVLAFTQASSYQLKQFKYRTPLYKSLQLDVRFNESLSVQKEKAINRDHSGTNVMLDMNLDQIMTFATDNRQHESYFGGFLQANRANTNDNGNRIRNGSLNPFFHYGFSERRFRSDYFIEYGGGASLRGKRDATKDSIIRSRSEAHVSVGASVGIGKGRLEYVQDAQAALFILNDLYREGIIKSTVSAELTDRLARLITEMKRKRIIDQRRRTIYQLTSIDSFLVTSGIISNCDSKTSAIINDNLFFGFTNDLSGREYTYGPDTRMYDLDFNRESYDEGEGQDFGMMPFLEPISDQLFRQHGTIIYARLSPGILWQATREKIGDSVVKSPYLRNHFLTITPSLDIGYEKHEAADLNWQKVIRLILSIRPQFGSDNFRMSDIRLMPSYSIGYYPNSRTVVEGTANINFGIMKGNNSKIFVIQPSAELRASYFVSARTVFRGFFRMYYLKFEGDQQLGNFSQSLQFSLRHYLY